MGSGEGRHGLLLEVHIHGVFRGVGEVGAVGASAARLLHVAEMRLVFQQVITCESWIVTVLETLVQGGGWHSVTGNGLFRARRAALQAMSMGHGGLAGGVGRRGEHGGPDNLNRPIILGLVCAAAGVDTDGDEGLVLVGRRGRGLKVRLCFGMPLNLARGLGGGGGRGGA